jgi:LacI family transcriptional regulator
MSGHFHIKDIAIQAGVGVATVDRVLNDRGGVHDRTRRRVKQAIEELAAQEQLVGLNGRTFFVDVIIEAPKFFCDALMSAIADEVPALLPVVFRLRQTISAGIRDSALSHLCAKIAKRGSHGVILMGQNSRGARSSISSLSAAGIPVVTFATDVPNSSRIAYAGMDNRRAGETAAFLTGKWLPQQPAEVLVSIRNKSFSGEGERAAGFQAMLSERFPHLKPIELLEGPGAPADFATKAFTVLKNNPKINAVYSIGGNNKVILDTFEQLGRKTNVFIAHDLDAVNRRLLRQDKIDIVLEHDLRRDVREACRAIMRHHKVLPSAGELLPNQIRIITPTSLD